MKLKRFLSLLLCMLMLLSVSPLALAEGETGDGTSPPTEDGGDPTGTPDPSGGGTNPPADPGSPTADEPHSHDETASVSYGNLTDTTHEATTICNSCPADYVPTPVTENHSLINGTCPCGYHVHGDDKQESLRRKDADFHILTVSCSSCPEDYVDSVDQEHNFGATGTEDCACGQSAPHSHGEDKQTKCEYKDEQNHSVITSCSTCPADFVDSVDAPHEFVDGLCACTYTQAASVTVTNADSTTSVSYYDTLQAAFDFVDDTVPDETTNQPSAYKTPGAVIKLLRHINEDNLSLTGTMEGTALEVKLDLNGKSLAPKTQGEPFALKLENVKLGITAGEIRGLNKISKSVFVVEDMLGNSRFTLSSQETLPLVVATGSMANAANFVSAMVNSFVVKNEDGTVSIVECKHENQTAPACTLCGAPIHGHAWTYSVAEATPHVLSAACADCPDYENPITVTINAPQNLVYDGTEKAATVTYSVENVLTAEIVYSETPKNAGSYTASVTMGEGEAAKTATLEFTVTPAPISNVTVSLPAAERVYSGSAYTPPVTVTGINSESVPADAYDVSYENNTAAGTAKAKVSFKENQNYSGSAEASFTIDKAPLVICANDLEVKTGSTPIYTYTKEGLKTGDTVASVGYRCEAGIPASKLGILPITPQNAVIKDGDTVVTDCYEIEYVPGLAYVRSTDSLQYKWDLDELSAVPEDLEGTKYDTLAKIKTALQAKVIGSGYTAANTKLYDLSGQISLDGGTSWIDLDESNFPKGGVSVTVPCPTNTAYNTHNYKLSHMFAQNSERLGTEAGDIEVPTVKDSSSGLTFTVNGLSPVLIGWIKTNVETGDNANIPLWIALMAGSAVAIAGIVIFTRKRRK